MSWATNWQAWGIPLVIVGVLILFVLVVALIRWYVRKPTQYKGTARIDDKTVVITGGNTGIGKETAKELLKRGARVIILCRDLQKGRVAAEELSEGGERERVQVYQLDLASLESVADCARVLKKKEPTIDILINNAGVMVTPQMVTKEGFELQFGTNHLGHFLLTLLLMDNLKAAAPSRIVNLSSVAHEYGRMHWDDVNMKGSYDPVKAYGQSKLANVLFTKSLAEKLKGSGVSAYAVHPGVVHTELSRHLRDTYGSFVARVFNVIMNIFAKTSAMGALTSIYCAVDESLAQESGKYYSGCREKRPARQARDPVAAERLWDLSLKMVGLNKDFQI